MIDIEKVDAMFEAGTAAWAHFDKRILFSFEAIVEHHADKADPLAEDDLRMAAARGWFPMQSGSGPDSAKEGCPAYAPDRVLFLRTLQLQGYYAEELRLIARHEEMLIDEMMTHNDLAYLDDDVELLLEHNRCLLDLLESGRLTTNDPEQPQKMTWLHGQMRTLEAYRANGIPEAKQRMVAKAAYRLRAVNDLLRIEIIEMDRGKIRAGYSPFVLCSSVSSWQGKSEGGPILWKRTGSILWEPTIQAAAALSDAVDVPSIRVPGFILRGEQINSVRTLRPTEYQQLWHDHDLDGYLHSLSEIRGERRCLNCLVSLPTDDVGRKLYCSEKCRNAAKQRRYRERNPDAVQRAQQRYWQSLDC
jgi:predicted nucleic acid-binding Zn ribbon protein